MLPLLGWLSCSWLSAHERWSPGSVAEHRPPLEVDGSPLDRPSRTALLSLKADQCLMVNLLSPLCECGAEHLQPAASPLWAKGGGPLCGHVGGIPGHVRGGQQVTKVLPDSLTPTEPHFRSLSGLCWLGECVLWCVFGWSCAGCWVEVPTRGRPPPLPAHC